MPSTATMAVSVTARTRGLEKGMRRAKRSVRDFGGSVKGAVRRIAGLTAALGGIGGAAGFVAITRSALRTIDAISKTADRLGFATEQLAGLQHAAAIMGSSTEGMNKGLEQFVRRLGEAATRTGEMRDAVMMLGLDAQELAAKGPAEAFRVVADRIARLPDVTQKAEAAYRLFGRRGVELVNLLQLGGAEIAKLTQEAEDLGFAFSRNMGAQVEIANDAMRRAKMLMQGTSQVIAIWLAPLITVAANRFITWGKEGEGAGKRIINILESVTHSMAYTINHIDTMRASLELLTATIQGLAMGIVHIFHEFSKIGEDVNQFFWMMFGRGGENRFGMLLQQLTADYEATLQRVADAMKDYHTGARGAAILRWFEKLRKDAKAAADEMLKIPPLETIPLIPLEKLRSQIAKAVEPIKVADFRQISLQRHAVGGINVPAGRPQPVHDKGIDTLVKLTQEEVRLLRATNWFAVTS